MTDELEQVLDQLRTISTETWIIGFVIVALIVLPIVQITVWWLGWRLLSGWPKWKHRIRRVQMRIADIMHTFAFDPHEIDSPTRTYRFAGHLGVGDLCDVDLATSGGRTYVVKTPRVAGCERLLEKEQAVVTELRKQCRREVYEKYLPIPVETIAADGNSISAFQWRDGLFPATEIMRLYPRGLDGRHIAWMLNRTLEILGFVHRAGWVHGAVLPPHLLYHVEDHGLQLIGWVHAQRLGEPIQVAPEQFREWYPPECLRREAATAATDIYLAAASMVALAGGNPLTGSMPPHVPNEIQRFLRKCLTESPSQRPADAWDLRDRFDLLLRGVYGPPQFSRLLLT